LRTFFFEPGSLEPILSQEQTSNNSTLMGRRVPVPTTSNKVPAMEIDGIIDLN
jgi:hypothetical protein